MRLRRVGRSRRRHPSSHPSSGGRFAHPSERDVAGLLSLYGVAWEYEPVEFALAHDGDGRVTRAFRPDFFLPEYGTFIEVTVLAQRLVTRKNRKIREFRQRFPEVTLHVLYRRQVEALLERHGLGVAPVTETRAA